MYVDNVKDIIHLLNSDDKKEFRSFINRQRSRKNRKDLELFEILCETESYPAKEIVKRLYNELNMNAYHSIRKRLLKHLTDFIIVKRIDEDTTSASSIMGLLTLSRFLFENDNDRVGWIYLIKSEQLAINSEQFDLLDNILNVQIENANSEHAPKIEEIIEKWKTNKGLADEDERANIANAILQIKLDLCKNLSNISGLSMCPNIEQISIEQCHKIKEFIIKRKLYKLKTLILNNCDSPWNLCDKN